MMESLDLGPIIIPDVGGVSLSMSMSMGFKQSFSQSVDEAFDESAFSLGDSDVDMSMA
jgi:hypothetical protein